MFSWLNPFNWFGRSKKWETMDLKELLTTYKETIPEEFVSEPDGNGVCLVRFDLMSQSTTLTPQLRRACELFVESVEAHKKADKEHDDKEKAVADEEKDYYFESQGPYLLLHAKKDLSPYVEKMLKVIEGYIESDDDYKTVMTKDGMSLQLLAKEANEELKNGGVCSIIFDRLKPFQCGFECGKCFSESKIKKLITDCTDLDVKNLNVKQLNNLLKLS